MYTVRHILRDGRERLVSVAQSYFDPEKNALVGVDAEGKPMADGLFEGGHAYVMNDKGKTVAVYNLNKKQ